MLLGNGVGVPLAVLVVMAILLIFSVGYTAMARHISNAGSFYAFTARGLGGVAGGAAAYIAVLAYNAMQIGLTACSARSPQVPRDGGVGRDQSALVGLVADRLGRCRHLRLSEDRSFGEGAGGAGRGRILIVVVILDVAIVGNGRCRRAIAMVSFTPEAFMSGSPVIGMLLCFAGFMGFEATTIYSEEARDPERTVPRATYLSVAGDRHLLRLHHLVHGQRRRCKQADGDIGRPTRSDPLHLHPVRPVCRRPSRPDHEPAADLQRVCGLLAFRNAARALFLRAWGVKASGGNSSAGPMRRIKARMPGSVLQTVLGIVVLAIFIIAGAGPGPGALRVADQPCHPRRHQP